ncbi:alpha/beta hydrolase [Stappia sp. F7233]|uniref:Palmitoyl-protein thioesterase ABHD10, mitochondrial n=1 Tax=Stappia albiluteola TaxID=2758565 RepID=A0A839A8F8_9HYPH|nr:alpha/beta hydrolase [Stappia albiluteola]MBA5775850.1 alpha/beta hydrolase [Stappia albiluteola]
MSAQEPQFITVGEDSERREIAVLRRDGRGKAPGIFWLSGFKSDMAGTKAEAVAEWAVAQGRPATRFDYSGHGVSGGDFEDGTISRWAEEALAVFNRFCKEPTIVIGSSMGGWIALLLARAHLKAGGRDASRIAGMVLIAPAPDFTEELMWKHEFTDEIRRTIMETGRYERPSDYSEDPYVITRKLIEDGRGNLLLDKPVETGCPVTILQGQQDDSVPWRYAVRLAEALASDDVVLTLIKDGDHRLSREEDIARLIRAVSDLAEREA